MNETSSTILNILRDIKLGWIADELAESLNLGNQIPKPFRENGTKRQTKGTSVVPYDEDEEMRVIVTTLTQYFIIMPRAWNDARKFFKSEKIFSPIKLKKESVLYHSYDSQPVDLSKGVDLGISNESDNEVGKPITEFSSEYFNEILPSLRKVLAKLWPNMPEDFAKHYSLPKGQV
jgi:hypothetical protein